MSDYTFQTLSDRDFERLVADLLGVELGVELHDYPAGPDQGIDLLAERNDGYRIVVQCKHYPKTGRSKLLEAAKKETGKEGYKGANRYVLATSAPMTARTEAELMRILNVPQCDVWGPDRLNAALARHPEVEGRHLKLWLSSANVLSRIIEADRWHRSFAMLEEAASRAGLWVETPAYRRVLDILDADGVCVLTGRPGVGKSYLAEFVALQRARAGWEVIDMPADLESSWRAFRRDDSRQLFVFSDPLGEIDLSPAAKENAHEIHRFMKHVREHYEDNKRLIITAPTEVLKRAELSGSDALRRIAGDGVSRYEITLAQWDEKARIEVLGNHLLFSGMSPEERRSVPADRRTISVVRHHSFNPRLIERICERFSPETTADEALFAIGGALDVPESVWSVSWSLLGELASEILLTMATLSRRPVTTAELRAHAGHTGGAREWQDAWRSLEPIWITVGGPAEERTVTLADPGLRDFLLSRLEDADMARERVDRARTLEQLAELGAAAGDLTADVPLAPVKRRPVLAHVLSRRRNELAGRVCAYASEEMARNPRSASRTLRTAAALLAVYQVPDVSGWIREQVSGLLDGGERLDAIEYLALAARIKRLPDDARRDHCVSDLRTAALASLRSLDDLDALETYAEPLDIDLRTAGDAARAIIGAELAHLADAPDPAHIRRRSRELRSRGEEYGAAIEVRGLLAYADELDPS